MRHRRADIGGAGRMAHRSATLRQLAAALFAHGQSLSTIPRAKAGAQPMVREDSSNAGQVARPARPPAGLAKIGRSTRLAFDCCTWQAGDGRGEGRVGRTPRPGERRVLGPPGALFVACVAEPAAAEAASAPNLVPAHPSRTSRPRVTYARRVVRNTIYARVNGYVAKWLVDIGDSRKKGSGARSHRTPALICPSWRAARAQLPGVGGANGGRESRTEVRKSTTRAGANFARRSGLSRDV